MENLIIINEILQWSAIISSAILIVRYKKRTDWIRVREDEKKSLLKWFQ